MKIAANTVSMDAAHNYTEVDQNNTVWQQGNSLPSSFRQASQSSSGNAFQENFFTHHLQVRNLEHLWSPISKRLEVVCRKLKFRINSRAGTFSKQRLDPFMTPLLIV